MVAYGEFGRPRPTVVVQANEVGQTSTTVLVCPITSGVIENLPIRPIVEANAENGLRVRSQVMTDKMFAVPRNRVRSVVGLLGPEIQSRLDSALLLVLGLAR